MRLIPDSGSVMLRGNAQWKLCALHDTLLADDVLLLASQLAPSPTGGSGDFSGGFAGLAFDSHCRLFHPRPEAGAIDYVLWGQTNPLGGHASQPQPYPITGLPAADGSFGPVPKTPMALACDVRDMLYIADPATLSVWLVNTWQQEVSRAITFSAAPRDLAACGERVYALLADGTTWLIAPCSQAERTAWPAVADADRLVVAAAADGGTLAWVLQRAGRVGANLYALHLKRSLATPYATDLVAEAENAALGALITLAQRPGEEFLRLRLLGNQPAALPSLSAPNYDGRGIALAPDARIAYWTPKGLRQAAPARTHYKPDGRVFSIALDAGHDQNRWGRMIVEACLPPGTQIRCWAFTRDELNFDDPIDGLGAGSEQPVLSAYTWQHFAGDAQTLYRDPSQRPLSPAPAEGFTFFDAPLRCDPGRYLWLVFELSGTLSRSPRLRAAQVEYPGHTLLDKLPRTLWREPATRDFLFRLLMPIAAILDEWQSVSATRQRLLDARITPSEALPWLAGFIGLVLDPCWPEDIKRRMILLAAPLFRTRGTLPSLRRMIEILTQAEVVVIENFRLRGGGVVGNPESQVSQAVLGMGYRVGGRIGEAQDAPLADVPELDFDDFAHRFSVTVVAALSAAQLDCARRLIELHKPAHTAFTLCTACAGIRAGVGAHIGISTVVGKSAGFDPAVLGDSGLNKGFVLGQPGIGGGAQ